MNAVERLGSYITRGVYTVAGPFHPFGGAVDIIVVEQQDGSFKSTPWYVKFGKFQGVLKRREKLVSVCVNDVDAGFHMFLDHKGEAYFLTEVDLDDDDGVPSPPSSGEDTEDRKRRKKGGGGGSEDLDSRRGSNLDEEPGNPARAMINESSGKMVVRSSSRRSRILGLVFGRRSMRGGRRDGVGVDRIDSLERAEIAADLLEVKWSTNLSDRVKEGATTNSSALASSSPLANGGEYRGLDRNTTADKNCDVGGLNLENFEQANPSSALEDNSIVRKNSELELPAFENSCSSMETSSALSMTAEKETQGNDCIGIGVEFPRSHAIMESECLCSGEKEPNDDGSNVLSMVGISDEVREVSGVTVFSSSVGLGRNATVGENCDSGALDLENYSPEDPSSVLENDSVVGKDAALEFSVFQNLCLSMEASSALPGNCEKETEGNNRFGIDAELQMFQMVTVSECLNSGGKESIKDGTGLLSMAENSDEERESENGALSSSNVEPGVENTCTKICNTEVIEGETTQEGLTVEVKLHVEVFCNTTEMVNERTLLPNLVMQVEEDSTNYSNLKSNGDKGFRDIDEHDVVTEEEHTSREFTSQSYGSDEMIDDSETEHLLEEHSAHTRHVEVFQIDDILENEKFGMNAVNELITLGKASLVESGKSFESQTELADAVSFSPDHCENAKVLFEEESTERFSDGGTSLAFDIDIHKRQRVSDKVATSVESTLSRHGNPTAEKYELETCNDVAVRTSVASSLKFVDGNLSALESGHIEGCQHLCATDGTLEQTTELETVHHQSSLSSELTFESHSSPLAGSITEDDMQDSLGDAYDMMPVEARKRSKPIGIPKPCKHERDPEPLSKSLPVIRSGISHLESFCVHTLSRSLSLNDEFLKMGTFGKDSPSHSEHLVASRIEMETEQCKPEGDTYPCETHAGMESERPTDGPAVEISLCKHLLSEGMGVDAASKVFDAEKVSFEKFSALGPSILKNDRLVVRINGQYFPWDAAAPIVLGMVSFGHENMLEPKGMIAVETIEKKLEKYPSSTIVPSGGSWRFWPFSFNKSNSLSTTRSLPSDCLSDTGGKPLENQLGAAEGEHMHARSTKKVRTIIPTSEQLASLNLKEGQNIVTFTFSTAMLGKQQVDARIYLWKWNTRIVISDVDGTITKSDVLGQFMPLVGKDWSHLGVAHLFSAIKDNGYQMLFLSARAISQAYLTRQFLFNLKQDGKALPDGPVVISPDGLFPSLFREVIRRAPHEFKIACLEDIRALFPSDCNPFYAGFGNRDTDEISYLKVGIPKGKIFIINPKGEVAVNRRVDTKSYHSLRSLVNGIFPSVSSYEQEDFNSWNYWKMPLPDIKD